MKRTTMVAVALLFASGCGGGSALPAKQPATTSNEEQPGAGFGGPPKQKTDEPGGSYAGPPMDGDHPEKKQEPGREAEPAVERGIESLAQAVDAFEQSYSQKESALATRRDCDLARKALQSMERAARKICELNGPGDPGGRCRTANARLADAREHVNNVCGSR